MKRLFQHLVDNIYKNKSELLPLVDMFRNREIEFGFSLQNIKMVFETFDIQEPTVAVPAMA